jgi:hypothetical protein
VGAVQLGAQSGPGGPVRQIHLDGGGYGCRRALRAPEHDVAALQVRDHVREPGIGERGAEVPHRDAVDTAEIDRAEERKEDHVAIVASTASGREVGRRRPGQLV